MNIKLLSLIEQRVNKAIKLLSEFLSNHKNDHHLLEKQISDNLRLVIETYVDLFKALKILPSDFLYFMREMEVHHHYTGEISVSEKLSSKVVSYLNEIIKSKPDHISVSGCSIIPLHLNYSKGFSDFSTIFGLCIIDHSAKKAQSFLYEFTLNARQINTCSHTLSYLDDILLKFKADPSLNTRNLSKINNLSYHQFQKDCKEYFETTFYDFTIKLKMISVVEDLMFSSLMIKEIVYKYRFAEYSNMYKFFHRTYNFPFKNITRFLSHK